MSMGLDPKYQQLLAASPTDMALTDEQMAGARRVVAARVEMTREERFEVMEMLGLVRVDDNDEEQIDE